jgi:hypothetical protein
MILETIFASANNSQLVTASLEINFNTRRNVAILCSVSGLISTGAPFTASAGMSDFTTMDPTNGVVNIVHVSDPPLFPDSAALFVNNIILATFVVTAAGTDAGLFHSNTSCVVRGTCQVILDPAI